MYKLEKINYKKRKKSKLELLMLSVNIDIVEIVDFIIEVKELFKKEKKKDDKKWILFDLENKVIKFDYKETNSIIELEKTNGLKIYYYEDLHNRKRNQKPPRIEYEYNGDQNIIYFKTNHLTLTKLCKKLYEQKIKFKEYVNEQRVFKGKKQTYEQIQKLKEKYDLEW